MTDCYADCCAAQTTLLKDINDKVKDNELKSRITDFTQNMLNPATMNCMQKIVADFPSNENIISKDFKHNLDFGCNGIHGKMGPGFNRINDVTVCRITQSLVKCIQQKCGANCESKGVVVAYDGHHNSKQYANVAAAVLLSNNCKVHLFQKNTPTALISFTIKKKSCIGGIQISGSDSGSEYNGMKIFNEQGCQIPASMEREIKTILEKNTDDCSKVRDLLCMSSGNLKDISKTNDPTDEMIQSYAKDVSNELCFNESKNNGASKIKFVYSCLHGDATDTFNMLYNECGFPKDNLTIVESQRECNPSYPTGVPSVKREKCFDEAKACAKKCDANIIVVNDPSGESFSVAEKIKDNSYRCLSSEEIAILLVDNRMDSKTCCSEKNKCVFVCANTTNNGIKKMCDSNGFKHEETLPGCKNINAKVNECYTNGMKPICACDDANNFCLTKCVSNFDGVAAAIAFCDYANKLYHKNMLVTDKVDALNKQYSAECCKSQRCYTVDSTNAQAINNDFKIKSANMKQIGKYNVKRVTDACNEFDSTAPNGKCNLQKSSHLNIKIEFDNGEFTLHSNGGNCDEVLTCNAYCYSAEKCRDEVVNMMKCCCDEIIEPTKRNANLIV